MLTTMLRLDLLNPFNVMRKDYQQKQNGLHAPLDLLVIPQIAKHQGRRMSLLLWNIRGMRSTTRKNELKQILQKKKIELFGIIEPKLKLDGIQSLESEMPKWDIKSNIQSNGDDERAPF